MWHQLDYLKYGFEMLRPDEEGDLEIVQCSLQIEPYQIVIEGPDNTIHTFDDILQVEPNRVDIGNEYLVAYYDGFYIQIKIEPGDGLVLDMWANNDDVSSPISEEAIWWDEL